MRIVHCFISNDFTVPEVITLATSYLSVLAWLLRALGCSRNLTVLPKVLPQQTSFPLGLLFDAQNR